MDAHLRDHRRRLRHRRRCYAGKGIYRLGFPNTGTCSLTPFDGANPPGIDTTVIATLLRWGNFDTKHNGAVWDAMEIPAGVPVPATQHLPASIYYDFKPSWWPAAVAWPPIGPDVTGGELVNGHAWKIPAQRCYESQNLGDGGAFSRATCYGRAEVPDGPIYLPHSSNAYAPTRIRASSPSTPAGDTKSGLTSISRNSGRSSTSWEKRMTVSTSPPTSTFGRPR